jgi:hypothetical protein
VAGVGLILVSAARLQPALADWSAAASISEKVGRDAERELSAAPAGSLFVFDAPAEMLGSAAHAWLWSFALPYALRPPYTDVDLTERVFVIAPFPIYCCWGQPWLETTRASVEAWAERDEQAPVVILRWNVTTGAMVRQSDAEDPSLRSRVTALADVGTVDEACAQLNALLTEPGSARNVCQLADQDWYRGSSS